MTKKEIKELIVKEYEVMEAKESGVATNSNYRLGKITGMLRTFVLLGYISKSDMFEIIDEVI